MMNDQPQAKIRVEHLSCFYGASRVINDLSLEVRPREVFGLMGPSKSGKSTFLRVLNRMCDLIVGARLEGHAWLDEEDILAPDCDLVRLRRRVGLVLSKPVPLPRSILENLTLAPEDVRRLKRIYTAACGTSAHSGLVGKFLIEGIAREEAIQRGVDLLLESINKIRKDPRVLGGRNLLLMLLDAAGFARIVTTCGLRARSTAGQPRRSRL